jgi:Rrf2 family protein
VKLSKTTTHAMRVLIYMAEHEDRVFSVHELHEALGIPFKYLGRLMPRLAEGGIVDASRGKNGGYRLPREKTSATLYRIIEIVEGFEAYEKCVLGFSECSGKAPCAMHRHWAPIKERWLEMLRNVTLERLARAGRAKLEREALEREAK